jgi:hypothetical protein
MENEQPHSWLQRLKDDSWEAELLISAASIFAIMKAFSLLSWGVDFFINNLHPEQYYIGYMISVFGYFALGILGAFFVIHFSLRAYWIGLIGLNSVFPDYSIKEGQYSEIYNKKMSEYLPKIPATIKTLDEICSVIFSASFAGLIFYLYVALAGAFVLTVYSFVSAYLPSTTLFIIGIVFAVFILFSSIVSIVANIKKYKQNVEVQTWLFRIAIWNSKVFYGPFYKYLLQTMMMFSSNYKQKPAIINTLKIMVVCGFGLAILQLIQSNYLYLIRTDVPQDETRIYPEHYLSNNTEKTFLLGPEIQSKIVSNQALSLFVPILKYETKTMAETCELNERDTKNLDDTLQQIIWREDLDCYATSISLFLNDRAISSNFIKIDHAITGQFGLFAFVSLEDMKQGTHHLTIIKKIDEDEQKKWQIPFYYSLN